MAIKLVKNERNRDPGSEGFHCESGAKKTFPTAPTRLEKYRFGHECDATVVYKLHWFHNNKAVQYRTWSRECSTDSNALKPIVCPPLSVLDNIIKVVEQERIRYHSAEFDADGRTPLGNSN